MEFTREDIENYLTVVQYNLAVETTKFLNRKSAGLCYDLEKELVNSHIAMEIIYDYYPEEEYNPITETQFCALVNYIEKYLPKHITL